MAKLFQDVPMIVYFKKSFLIFSEAENSHYLEKISRFFTTNLKLINCLFSCADGGAVTNPGVKGGIRCLCNPKSDSCMWSKKKGKKRKIITSALACSNLSMKKGEQTESEDTTLAQPKKKFLDIVALKIC